MMVTVLEKIIAGGDDDDEPTSSIEWLNFKMIKGPSGKSSDSVITQYPGTFIGTPTDQVANVSNLRWFWCYKSPKEEDPDWLCNKFSNDMAHGGRRKQLFEISRHVFFFARDQNRSKISHFAYKVRFF